MKQDSPRFEMVYKHHNNSNLFQSHFFIDVRPIDDRHQSCPVLLLVGFIRHSRCFVPRIPRAGTGINARIIQWLCPGSRCRDFHYCSILDNELIVRLRIWALRIIGTSNESWVELVSCVPSSQYYGGGPWVCRALFANSLEPWRPNSSRRAEPTGKDINGSS